MNKNILNSFCGIVTNIFSQKEINLQKVISFLFARIIYITLFALIDILLLYSLNVFFGILIERFFMLTVVVTIELLILIFTNKEHDIEYKNNDFTQEEKTDIFNHTNILLFGYKNILYNFYYVLPFLIAYGIYNMASWIFYLNSVILVVIIPLTVGLVLFLLPKPKRKKTKFVLVVRGIIINIVTLFIWLFLYYGVRIDMVFATSILPIYSPKFTVYTNISQILNFPITLNNYIEFDIFNELLIIFNFVSKNIIELALMTSFLCILFTITIKISKYIESFSSKKKFDKKLKPFIRNNNIKVRRINHTIRNCMPRSPTKIFA